MFEIGATLREARVRKRLTLQQAEEDTKIRVKYLQAMENEEFDVLPAPTYVKGFLRGYATYLGLDANLIIDEYRTRYMPAREQSAFSGASALRPRHPHRRSGLAFVAVVAVLILALIYILGLRGSGKQEGPKVNPSALHSLSPSPRPSPSPASSSPVVTPGRSVVRIVASGGSCYFDVRRGSASGAFVYQGVLPAGAAKKFTTDGALAIVVGGNPASLTITVNGVPVRTVGDKTGTVYLIAKGKVTKQ